MSNSYLDNILSYFASMDIEMLRLALKDEYTYQDTSKEIFLKEVDAIFKSYKSSKDTELEIYKGRCAGIECDNCGKPGYRLVGNHSRNYFDLLFEIDGDDIRDIYHCSQFRTYDIVDNLESKAEIYINLDDQVTFEKTPEYWSKVYAAQSAWSEIITTPPREISFQELCYWLDRHSITDDMIGEYDVFEPPMNWTSFSSLYAELVQVRFFITNHVNEFQQANFQSTQIKNEQDLLTWMVKYEHIYDIAPYFLKFGFIKQNKSFSLYPNHPILFKDQIFIETIEFIQYFRDHFDNLFRKYSTYIDSDNLILYSTSGEHIDGKTIFSLKYHLANRKVWEDIGIDVPYYLNQTKTNQ